jgi:hypothetical protein
MTSQTIDVYPLCGHSRLASLDFHSCTDALAAAPSFRAPSTSASAAKEAIAGDSQHKVERGQDVCYTLPGLCEACAMREAAEFEGLTGVRFGMPMEFAEKSF